MKTALAAALAALLLATPAGAQQAIAPDAAGVWGFAYGDLAAGQSATALAKRDVISCLAEPALIAPAAEGYVLNAYKVDPDALAAGQVRYIVSTENLCTYDPASGLEGCRAVAEPADTQRYWTYYEPLDPAAGIYRAHPFQDDAEVEAFKASGQPPADGFPYVAFLCPKEIQPGLALLRAAVEDPAGLDAASAAMNRNFGLCGHPLCGAEAQRLRALVAN